MSGYKFTAVSVTGAGSPIPNEFYAIPKCPEKPSIYSDCRKLIRSCICRDVSPITKRLL